MSVQNQVAPKPRARAGRWSIVLAVVALLFLAGGAVGLVLAQGEPQGDGPSWATMSTVVVLWFSRIFNLVGAALGVIALVRGAVDRIAGILGLILNVAMIYFGDWLAGRFIVLFAGL